MSTLNETTLFQELMVRITDHRILVGTQSFPVAGITAVTVARRPRDKRSLRFVVLGAFFILWSMLDQTGYYREFFNWGVVLCGVGMFLLILSKPSYVVQIRRLSGISDLLGSTDLSFVRRIVAAVQQAIAQGERAKP